MLPVCHKNVLVTSANIQSNTQELTSLTTIPFPTSEDSFVTLSTLVLSQEIEATSIKLEISGSSFQRLSLTDHDILLLTRTTANSSNPDFMEEVGWSGEEKGQIASIIWSLATFCQIPPDKKLCSGQTKLLSTCTLMFSSMFLFTWFIQLRNAYSKNFQVQADDIVSAVR